MDALSGLTIVFTGKMSKVRHEMELEARNMGAWVENRVTQNTDWLVTGSRVGKTKTQKGKSVGCRMLTEAEYRTEVATRKQGTAKKPMPERSEQNDNALMMNKPDWVRRIQSEKAVRF